MKAKLLKWILLIVLPFFVILLPLTIILNTISPWKVSERILKENHQNDFAFCIGLSRQTSNSGETKEESIQRSFILFPSVFVEPSILSITKETKNGKSEIKEESSVIGFLFFLTIYILVIFGLSKTNWKKLKIETSET